MTTGTLLIGIGLGLALSVVLRLFLRRRRPTARQVEAPNSSFASPFVVRAERRELWRSLAHASLHPANRDEVARLLARVDRDGDEALLPSEKALLDRLVDAVRVMGEPASGPTFLSKRTTS